MEATWLFSVNLGCDVPVRYQGNKKQWKGNIVCISAYNDWK